MMPRYMVQWRVYVYANSLYSLPERHKSDYRDVSPQYFSRNPFEIHRVMNWVNRDISVLVKTGKADVFCLYETILDLLPRVSMKSSSFSSELFLYIGPKTHQFVHELINFARSPYNDLIAYECNTQYRALPEDENAPSTSSMARMRRDLTLRLHSFVEFSRRINHDDCGGFEADLELEDEDYGELQDLMREQLEQPLPVQLGRPTPAPRASQVATGQGGQQSAAQTGGQTQQQQQQQQQPAQQSQQPGAQAGAHQNQNQQQQQQQQQPGHQPSTSSSSGMLANRMQVEDLDLEMAIERSMFDARTGQDGNLVLPSGRLIRVGNARLLRNLHAHALGSISGSRQTATRSRRRHPR
ncbi:putative vacuolar protein sorting-associated protein 13F [Drosophila elegans]|uniref:putative vacuolar protein sorting-associated protein 13F n=1 Tax=Drosophila elegans TaxID=30023 RepID=UPI001BC84320|nr:putative vacuolar protein sorting-associated protein 13F [Drosophila elegans]